jgi:REP-associated tyrosine transposase
MGYVRRTSLPDGWFHVWIRGVCDVAPFPTPEDRTAALRMLLTTARRFEVEVEAACVMTTHYHAIVLAESEALSSALQSFHTRYAREFNRRYRRFGHVFAERFQCRTVDEDGVYDRCGYVLGNPLKAGLSDRVAGWPWSYCRSGLDAFYVGSGSGATIVTATSR